jgi:protoheme IX farnesyltransferase
MNQPSFLTATASRIKSDYWPLIKSRQTFLLTITGITGYLSLRPHPFDWAGFLGMIGSLIITISGCTIINMVYDIDIDIKMKRTSRRPLPSGHVSPKTATILGWSMLVIGLLWALALSLLYFVVVLGGAVLDLLIYTVWLKRHSAWSIVLGGLSGGMPILAGRALAIGRIDLVGILLGLTIVCWIPSHNLTLNLLHPADYYRAGIPIFPNVYGPVVSHILLIFSSLLAGGLMVAISMMIGLHLVISLILTFGGIGLVGFAIYVWIRFSNKTLLNMFKYSSFYMLGSMLILALAGFH